MRVNKKNLFIGAIILLILAIFGVIHNSKLDIQFFGWDPNLAEFTEIISAYNGLYDVITQFLLWILIGIFLFTIWGLIISQLEPKMTKTVINTLRVLGRMLIIPLTIIGFLNNFPAFEGTLLSVSAILGAAIGFASTTTVGNFLAGLYIMGTRPFLIGDYIILPDSKGVEGRVKEITINYTKITLPTGNTILVSNARFLGQSIINTRTTEDQFLFRKDFKRRFVYPLMWGANSDDQHIWSVRAIEKTAEEFNNKLTEPVTWFVYSRNRLDTTFQINLVSDSATKLLNITGDFLTSLSANYHIIKRQENL
ncbi:mechanosensitive ion channel family protein [Candidatus Hodarchaeum mangrovi]